MAPAQAKRQNCLLFHIFAYFFGVGTGFIAIVNLADQDPPVVTWILIPTGTFLSLLTCVVHVVFLCKGVSTPLAKYKQSLLDITGLFLASAFTYAGTFTFVSGEGTFFFCGMSSASFFLMASVALTVTLCRSQKKNTTRAAANNGNNPEPSEDRPSNSSTGISLISAAFPVAFSAQPWPGEFSSSRSQNQSFMSRRYSNMYLPRARADPIVEHQGQGNSDISMTQLDRSLLVPLSVALPSYAEVVESTCDAPPKYSEIDSLFELEVPSSQLQSSENFSISNELNNSADIPEAPPPYDSSTHQDL